MFRVLVLVLVFGMECAVFSVHCLGWRVGSKVCSMLVKYVVGWGELAGSHLNEWSIVCPAATWSLWGSRQSDTFCATLDHTVQ